MKMRPLRSLLSHRYGPFVTANVGVLIGAIGVGIGFIAAKRGAPAPLVWLALWLFIVGWIIVALATAGGIIQWVKKFLH